MKKKIIIQFIISVDKRWGFFPAEARARLERNSSCRPNRDRSTGTCACIISNDDERSILTACHDGWAGCTGEPRRGPTYYVLSGQRTRSMRAHDPGPPRCTAAKHIRTGRIVAARVLSLITICRKTWYWVYIFNWKAHYVTIKWCADWFRD